MTSPNQTTTTDPFRVLGVTPDASEDEIRGRYLQLVKQFPPDREAERFRQIRAAYDAAKDPLTMANRLLRPPSDTPQPWEEVIAAQEAQPPALTVDLILSLGNRNESTTTTTDDSTPAS